jgi:transposase
LARQEHKSLLESGDDRLTGSKQLWLFNPKNLSGKRKKELAALKEHTLKTSRAWAIKEHFRRFWNYTWVRSADEFFSDWYGWAARSRLKPVIKTAKMLRRHLRELLNYFNQRITAVLWRRPSIQNPAITRFRWFLLLHSLTRSRSFANDQSEPVR